MVSPGSVNVFNMEQSPEENPPEGKPRRKTMPNMDYPGPCPACGAEGECEHREQYDYEKEAENLKQAKSGEQKEMQQKKEKEM